MIVWESTARGRYDLVVPAWDPAGEWRYGAKWVAVGMEEVYFGHDGVKRAVEDWSRMWSERSFTVREILDGGDTWVFRVNFWGRGEASGAPTQMDASAVTRFDPLIVSHYTFLDDEEALREAGFAPLAPDGSVAAQ